MLNKVLLLAVVAATSTLVLSAKLDELHAEARHDEDHLDDDDDDKKPYSFAYEASRHYNGAPDREHREERREDGVVRGVYRYVDPNLQVQEVIYTADERGFHVQNSNTPQYTEAQLREREKHAQLFKQIAEEHVRIGGEQALRAEQQGYQPGPHDNQPVDPHQVLEYSSRGADPASLPAFSPVVERARQRHQELFTRIAEQHARIAAERKTDPRAEETGEPYEYQYDTPLKTVEVVSGSVGPSVLERSARVIAPGEDHPDFQGYGVPLGTFRDDITEEEALALLEEANERHFEQFRQEADEHERLVLSFMPSGVSQPRRQGTNRRQGNRALSAGQGQRHSLDQADPQIHSGTSTVVRSPTNTNRFSKKQTINQSQNSQQEPRQHSAITDLSAKNMAFGSIPHVLQPNSGNQLTQGHQQVTYNSGVQPPSISSRNTGRSRTGGNLISSISPAQHQFTSNDAKVLDTKAKARPDQPVSVQSQGSHLQVPQATFVGPNGGSPSGQSLASYKEHQQPAQFAPVKQPAQFAPVKQPAQFAPVEQPAQFASGQSQGVIGVHDRGSNAPIATVSGHQETNRNLPTNIQRSALSYQSNHVQQAPPPSQGGFQSPEDHLESVKAHQRALAVLAEQEENHLRQFRKIADAHERIGDEHHQLTLAALQKHRMKLQNW